MLFEKGNKAAAKPSKKAVAALIRARLAKDGDSLSGAQFTTLVSKFNTLTTKRRRLKKPEPMDSYLGVKKSNFRFGDLTGEEAVEAHKYVLQREAEELEARRKEWRAKQPNGNTA